MKKSYLVAIIVVVLVVIGGVVAWAVTRSTNEEGSTNNQSQTSESADQAFDASEFTKDKKEKPLTGENHSIIGMNLEYTANYDRVVFSFASNAANEAPGYIAELKDKVIWIRFLDTRDVDENYNNIFQGEKNLTGEGNVIEKVELWYPKDDSLIGAKIFLDEARGFRVNDEDLFITLDVECGCGS